MDSRKHLPDIDDDNDDVIVIDDNDDTIVIEEDEVKAAKCKHFMG